MPSPAEPSRARLDDPRLVAAAQFFEASSALSTILDRALAEECDLPAPWFEVLLRLARAPAGRLHMSEVAAQVGLSPSGLTRAVDRLEAAGLVTREPSPDDRRVAFASLSAAGLRRIEAAVPVYLRLLDEHFVGVLTARQRAQLGAALRKVINHTKSFGPSKSRPMSRAEVKHA